MTDKTASHVNQAVTGNSSTEGIDNDIEKRKIDLDRYKFDIETKTKKEQFEEDIKKRKEMHDLEREKFNLERERFNAEKGFKVWERALTPLGAAVFAGLIGLFGSVINGYNANSIESSKQAATERIERQKFEANLILDAIKTGGTGTDREAQIAANLTFLAEAGLINLTKEKIAELKTKSRNQLPSLPLSSFISPFGPLSDPIQSKETTESGFEVLPGTVVRFKSIPANQSFPVGSISGERHTTTLNDSQASKLFIERAKSLLTAAYSVQVEDGGAWNFNNNASFQGRYVHDANIEILYRPSSTVDKKAAEALRTGIEHYIVKGKLSPFTKASIVITPGTGNQSRGVLYLRVLSVP
jgi:hypothetical protein